MPSPSELERIAQEAAARGEPDFVPPVNRDAALAAKIEADCMHGDFEGAHSTADELLIEELRHLGYAKTIDAWEKVGKWYA